MSKNDTNFFGQSGSDFSLLLENNTSMSNNLIMLGNRHLIHLFK